MNSKRFEHGNFPPADADRTETNAQPARPATESSDSTLAAAATPPVVSREFDQQVPQAEASVMDPQAHVTRGGPVETLEESDVTRQQGVLTVHAKKAPVALTPFDIQDLAGMSQHDR